MDNTFLNMDEIDKFIEANKLTSERNGNLIYKFFGNVFFDKNNQSLDNCEINIKKETNRWIVSFSLGDLDPREYPDSFWSDRQSFKLGPNDSLIIEGQAPSHSNIGKYKVTIFC